MPGITHYEFTKVDGLCIFYREAGPPNAPTILLLHGFPSSSRMFDPLLLRLSDKYHLITLGSVTVTHPTHFDSFEFSVINSGNTMRKAAPRGSATFLRLSDSPFGERRRRRGLGHAIAEVTYPYAVTSSQLAAICMTSEIVLG